MCQSRKVLRVMVRLRQRGVRIVFLLAAQVGLGLRHAPVAMSSRPMFLVKFQIVWIAGISRVAAPDLDPCFWIAREECHFVFLRAAWRVRPIRTIERCSRFSAIVFGCDRAITRQ